MTGTTQAPPKHKERGEVGEVSDIGPYVIKNIGQQQLLFDLPQSPNKLN